MKVTERCQWQFCVSSQECEAFGDDPVKTEEKQDDTVSQTTTNYNLQDIWKATVCLIILRCSQQALLCTTEKVRKTWQEYKQLTKEESQSRIILCSLLYPLCVLKTQLKRLSISVACCYKKTSTSKDSSLSNQILVKSNSMKPLHQPMWSRLH